MRSTTIILLQLIMALTALTLLARAVPQDTAAVPATSAPAPAPAPTTAAPAAPAPTTAAPAAPAPAPAAPAPAAPSDPGTVPTTPAAIPPATTPPAVVPGNTVSSSLPTTAATTSPSSSAAVPCIPNATVPGNLTCTDPNSYCNTTSQLCNAKLANNLPCSSNIECSSGNCNNGVCSDSAGASDTGGTDTGNSSSSNKVLKIAIAGGVAGLLVVVGFAFWAIRSRNKKKSSGYKSGGPGAAPSVYNDDMSLSVEQRTGNGGYPFSAPYAGFSSSNIQEPVSAHYEDDSQTFNGTNGQAGYVDQRMMTEYNGGQNIGLTIGQNIGQNAGYSSNMNNDGAYYSEEYTYENNSLEQRPVSPASFPTSSTVVVPMSEHQVYDKDSGHVARLDLATAARDLLKQGTVNPEVMLNGDAVAGSKSRDSNGSYISQDDDRFLTTEPIYFGIDNFADDEMRPTNNKAGRYKMQSMYSRDSNFFAGTPNVPPNPLPVRHGSSSKRTLNTFGDGDAGSDYSDGESIISVSRVPQASVSTQHAPIFKSYQASSENGSNLSEMYRRDRN